MFAHNKALKLKLVFHIKLKFFFYIQYKVYVVCCHEGGTLGTISSAKTHTNADLKKNRTM